MSIKIEKCRFVHKEAISVINPKTGKKEKITVFKPVYNFIFWTPKK